MLLLAGCQTTSHDWDDDYPEGTCMYVVGSGDAITEYGTTQCSEPHSHVVLARVGPGAACPAGTDQALGRPGTRYATWCLRADSMLTPDPSR